MLEREKEEWINKMYLGHLASLSISFVPRLSDLGMYSQRFSMPTLLKELKPIIGKDASLKSICLDFK